MPLYVPGNVNYLDAQVDLGQVQYDYKYPKDLDLRPTSALHSDLVSKIMMRANESRGIMSSRFSDWQKVDHVMTAYISQSEEEKILKSEDERRPTSVVFPYSYAIVETILSYLTSVFLQSPIFRYSPTSPEDTLGTILLEKIIEKHTRKFKVGQALHTLLRDSLVYGMGIVSPVWEEMWGYRRVAMPDPVIGKIVPMDVEEVLFEGNALLNIDPYNFLPDPNVGITNQQRGEFVGWIQETNLMDLLQSERTDGEMFNVKYLKNMANSGSILTSSGDSGRSTRFGGKQSASESISKKCDVIYMYIKIIPSDWKLGDQDYPVKWLFGVVNDKILIKARPARFNHNMYPVGIAAPDSDGYSITPVSRAEMLYGLQGVMDFLFNSHIENVRKAINDVIIYDPYSLNSNDMEAPGAGKLVRTRQPAWGKGVSDLVMQLKVSDLTQANMADTAILVQWMQKIGSADDSMMGVLRQGGPERLTKSEFQGTRSGSTSRLERLATLIGMQALQDIGYMFAVHTQQMMTKTTYVKTVGRWQELLMQDFGAQVQQGMIKVDPFQLLVDYDVDVIDGSLPGANFNESWLKVWDSVTTNPNLMPAFDILRMFKFIARSMGANNVDDFINPNFKFMPDQQLLEELQAGNLVPYQSQGGAQGGAPTLPK